MGDEGYDVKVYIYDISKGMARAMSQAFLGKQLNGIWHTGIVVYGQEFYFGGTGGIECCPPGGTILGQPDSIKNLGQTQIPYEMFIDYLGDLAQSSYRPERYHLLEHNCNTFSSDVAQFLTGNDIPSQITGLPAEVLSTPFGQMIKPFIDSMSVNPSGGHAVFPQSTPAPQAPSSASKPTSQSQQRSTPTEPASQSQNKTSPKKPQKNQTETNCRQEPFVFHQEIEDVSYWSQSKMNISPADQVLLKEVYEFLCLTDPTWSLGREHLSVIVRLVLDSDRQCQVQAGHLLSRLILKEDIVQLLCHDKQSSFPKLLETVEDFDTPLKTCVVEMLTNCCSLQPGRRLVLQERNRKLMTSLCVCSLLGDSQQLTQSTTALSQNLCLEKLPEDMELELGSALLNCVEKDLNETATYHMLIALTQLMKSSSEVQGLASVLGINCDRLKIKSDRVAALCAEVAELL